ncbi:MAG: hypothetical protein NT126_01890 [Bacteroidetes bacterium]|nr:hypothetical protein [Bacteroidota bacterium]
MKKLKEKIQTAYYKYKDFFPADLWALLIMILMFILGFIFLT